MYTDAQKCSHIFDLQTFLRRIQQSEGSAAPLVPDGIFGAQTAAAVREYQQQHCLPVTGIADQRTWNAIYASYAALIAADALPMQTAFFPPESDTVLKPGAKSPSVYVLQLMLGETAPHYTGLPPCRSPASTMRIHSPLSGVRRKFFSCPRPALPIEPHGRR